MHRILSSAARRAVCRSSLPLTLPRVPLAASAATSLRGVPLRSAVSCDSLAFKPAGVIATAHRCFADSVCRSSSLDSGDTAAPSADLSASAAPPSLFTGSLQLHGTPLSHFTRRIRILLSELGVPFEFVRSPSVLAPSPDAYAHNPLLRVPSLMHGGRCIIDSEHIARYIATSMLREQQGRGAAAAPSVVDQQSIAVRRADAAQLTTDASTARLSSSRLVLCASVLSSAPSSLNALAVLTGVMSDEVTLLLARRGGMSDEQIAAAAYFQKRAAAINNGLTWIEQQITEAEAAAREKRGEQSDPTTTVAQLSSDGDRVWPSPLAPTAPLLWTDISLVCMWQHLAHSPVPLIAPLDRYPRIAERAAVIAQRESVASTGLERSLADAKAVGWIPG